MPPLVYPGIVAGAKHNVYCMQPQTYKNYLFTPEHPGIENPSIHCHIETCDIYSVNILLRHTQMYKYIFVFSHLSEKFYGKKHSSGIIRRGFDYINSVNILLRQTQMYNKYIFVFS